MLTIRREQFKVFEDEQMVRFIERVIAFLREHFADMRDMSSDTLRPAIKPLIEKAKGYGLTTERQVVTYIAAAKKFGKDFDEAMPQASSILNNRVAHVEKKLQHLQALLDR